METKYYTSAEFREIAEYNGVWYMIEADEYNIVVTTDKDDDDDYINIWMDGSKEGTITLNGRGNSWRYK